MVRTRGACGALALAGLLLGAEAGAQTVPGNPVGETQLGDSSIGWTVIGADVASTYDVEVLSTAVVDPPDARGVQTESSNASGVATAVFVLRNSGDVANGGIGLDDIGAVANNGSIATTISGSANTTGVLIQDGALATAAGSGLSALINGELGAADPSAASIYSQNGTGVTMNGAFYLFNRGTIESDAAAGVLLTRIDDPIEIPEGGGTGPTFNLDFIPELADRTDIPNEVHNNGTIVGATDGVFINGGFGQVFNIGSGSVEGESGVGVLIRNDLADNPTSCGTGKTYCDLLVENATSASITGATSAVEMRGVGRVDNSGTLTGGSAAAVLFTDQPGTAPPGFDNEVINSGVIVFGLSAPAIDTGDGDDDVNNSGQIRVQGTGTPAASGTVILTGRGEDVVLNSDLIRAPDGWTAISTGGSEDVVTNTGTLEAPNGRAIFTGAGADQVFLFDGNVEGDVDGGVGADSLTLQGNGTLDGDVLGFGDAVLRIEDPSDPADSSRWTVEGVMDAGILTVESGELILNGDVTSANVLVETGELVLGATTSAEFVQTETGTLTVRGQVLPGSPDALVAVGTGGTLAGDGIVTRNVFSDGRVAPGRAEGSVASGLPDVGTLLVQGDIEMGAGSSMEIHYDATTNDILDVRGNLDGEATVVFLPVGGTSGDHSLSPFILHTGSANANLTAQSSAVANYQIIYPADDPTGTILPGQIGFRFDQRTYQEVVAPNHKSLAGVLDDNRCDDCGELGDLYQELDRMQTAAELDHAVGMLSPESLAYTPLVTFTTTRRHSTSHVAHMRNLRLGRRLPKGEEAGKASEAPVDLLGGEWALTAALDGVFTQFDDHASYDGFDSMGGGALLGLDRFYGDDVILGFSVGANYTRISSERYITDNDIITPRLAVYAGYELGGWYLDGVAFYGANWISSTRTVDINGVGGTADSSHLGHEVTGYVGTGYMFDLSGWSFGPTAELQYTGLWESAYDESGAGDFNLDITSENTASLQSRFGFQAAYGVQFTQGVRTFLQLHADWSREWIYERVLVQAEMQGLVGDFATPTARVGKDGIVAGIGIKTYLQDNIVLEVDYEAEFGRTRYMAHTLGLLWTVEY